MPQFFKWELRSKSAQVLEGKNERICYYCYFANTKIVTLLREISSTFFLLYHLIISLGLEIRKTNKQTKNLLVWNTETFIFIDLYRLKPRLPLETALAALKTSLSHG